jgi:site-specific recombinase XerD
MLNIPPDLLGRFVTVLEERGVPLAQNSYYKKWLRYYVDFCDKYRLEATSSKSQAQFLDKLREMKQTDWQIKQAAHAVSLYWDVQRALKPSAAASGAEPLSRAAEAAKPCLLPANYDIRTIQELLGHSDVRTTMIYTHTIRSWTLKEAKSPLDF